MKLGTVPQTSVRDRHQAVSPVRRHLEIIAAIEHSPVIAKILAHLGLPARAPPRSPAAGPTPNSLIPNRYPLPSGSVPEPTTPLAPLAQRLLGG